MVETNTITVDTNLFDKETRIILLKKSLFQTIANLKNIQHEVEDGIIDIATAEEKVAILKKEIQEKKKRLLGQLHIGKRGNLLSFGRLNEAKGLYVVKTSDGKKLYSKSEEGLIDALMSHYGITLESTAIKDVFERAMEKYARKHPGKSKTIYNYNLDFKRFINDDLANKDIRNVNKDELEDYLLYIISTLSLKVAALKNFKTLLNLIYDKAIDEGLITQNIAKGIKLPGLIEYCDQSLSHRKPADVRWTPTELKDVTADLWDRINRYYCPYAYGVLLHSELGCRPGELICLKWSDVSIEEKKVRIERMQRENRTPKQSFTVIEFNKNEKGVSAGGREVPLSESAIYILNALYSKKKALGIESEWIFTDITGKPLNKKGYFDFFNNLQKKHHTRATGSYVLRREVSARLEANGLPPSVRGAVLGQTPATNLNNYTFADPDYLSRTREALNTTSPLSHPKITP